MFYGGGGNFWVGEGMALFGGIVVQVLAQPTLDLFHAHSFALGVVDNLVAVDLAQTEVTRLRVGEVEPAHA